MKQTKLVDYYVRLTPSLNSWNTTDEYVGMALRALMSDCKRHLDFEQIDYEMVYEDYCSHCGQVWEEECCEQWNNMDIQD